jgi:ATP-dependent DNA helicase RecG
MILSLIAEATECEFKSALEREKPISWLKSISAFANGVGGTIFFGVNNDSSITGLSDLQSDAEFISNRITLPPLQVVVCGKDPIRVR